MRGSGPLWGLLNRARRANLAEDGAPPPVRSQGGITRRRMLAALGAAAALPALGWPTPSRAQSSMRVAIIGGGLAGLTALDALSAAGVEAHLYEARGRLGGRVLTANNAPEPGLDIEDGGNLINTDHADMLALAERFGIALIDRKPMRARSRYVADGRLVSDAGLIRDLRPIAAQIGRDAEALDADYENVAPRFDAISVKAYLDGHAKLMKPYIRALLEATVRTEFGEEPDRASAIELLFNLPVVDGKHVELISLSDERFILKGGSSSVVKALSEPLMPRISTGHALQAIVPEDGRLALRFANGKSDHADRVIVTVPAPLMRTIDYGGLLPESWAALVGEIDCGRNEKINAGYAARIWEKQTGPAGAAWAVDTKGPGIFSEFWDASSGQPGQAGVLTWFFGGDQVDALMAAEPETILRRAEAAIAPAVPGLNARTMRRTAWGQDPYARGAYSTFLPGQLTRFAPHFWLEEDGEVTQQAVAGPIVFAGEHLSDAFPGYMNGGAQTGRLAAAAILGELQGAA
ncbi:MAG TPA: NAD(P)/FAD-dependent oxidoreductase [Sphingopyxis sp.]|nr:NAD(P)/FAD-dependent oxidoreductase [Sphingopyxis sp.]HMP45112.1 NAD(P)/FAD-dependent oxidoreductase [Sphingopyxis sp.]HMQ17971.1 NAD(P)/FAD-dependent oxidoreductase [Sphingopyxis sp.]